MNQHEMAASQYLSALEAKAAAEKSVANAKSFLVRAADESGNPSIVVDGKAVVLTDAIRRNFSAETLRGMVPEAIYNACAKHSIDSRSFDRSLCADSSRFHSPVTRSLLFSATTAHLFLFVLDERRMPSDLL